MSDQLERGAPVVLSCVGCDEPIVILPPLMPAKLEKMLPAMMAALGAPLPKRDIDGATSEPTMFGLRGTELTQLMQPRCFSCARAALDSFAMSVIAGSGML